MQLIRERRPNSAEHATIGFSEKQGSQSMSRVVFRTVGLLAGIDCMDAVLEDAPFVDFGNDPLFPFPRVGLRRVDGDDTEDLRGEVRRFVPKVSGVYGMIDALGRLIYVGKSKCLRNRLMSYFLPNNEEDKAGRIINSTSSIVWETQPSEFAALLREQFLIRSFQPRFNVQGLPKRQQPVFICLGRSPAEQLYTTRKHDPKAIFALGPLFGASRAGRAVEVLNRMFRLRDCSSSQPCSFTDQLQLFDIELRPGCIRLEIETCLGPCISACSRNEYLVEVQRAKSFLAGEDASTVSQLEQTMQRAASNLHFEQAARLREDIKAVSWLFRRATDIATARDHYTFVYPVQAETRARQPRDEAEQDIWYLIRRGVIEGAMPAPRNVIEKRATREKLRRWLDSDNTVGEQFAPRPETLALVASWFRNHRGELKSTFVPGQSRAPITRAKAKAKRVAPK